MKKVLVGIITGCLAVAMATSAMAEQKEKVDIYEQNKLVKSVVFIDGKSEYFVNSQTPGIKMDAAPYISQSRTFVPVRFLANALGVTDEKIGFENNMVALNTEKIVAKMYIGQKKIIANDISIPIDVAPELKSGRTYLPARFVAEALGYNVGFINGMVVCYTGQQMPSITVIEEYIKGTKTQQPVVPSGTTKELFAKAKQLEGKPFNFVGWNFAPRIQESMQRFWDSKTNARPVIQEVTVEDLHPNGIDLDGEIVHDLKVTKDGVTVTATSSGKSMPRFYLVEEGNVVRYSGGGGYMGQYTGTLTEEVKYIHGSDDSFYTTPDLTKVTHIMFEYGDQLLKVQNPIYQGGN